MPICQHCGAALIDRRPDARFCSDNCRAKARHAQREHRLTAAEGLLRRQLGAVAAGDTETVIDTIQEAELLLG
jgi:hypothetical protein